MSTSEVTDDQYGEVKIQLDSGIRKCYAVSATPENTLEEIQSLFENVAKRYSANLEITKTDDRVFVEFDRNALNHSVVRMVSEISGLKHPFR